MVSLTHVKTGVVRCLNNRAREIISMQDSIQKEIDHQVRVVEQNSYPANFICNASASPIQKTADTSSHDAKQEEEKRPLVVVLYMIGMSESSTSE